MTKLVALLNYHSHLPLKANKLLFKHLGQLLKILIFSPWCFLETELRAHIWRWEIPKLSYTGEILQGNSDILPQNIANYGSCQFNNRLFQHGVWLRWNYSVGYLVVGQFLCLISMLIMVIMFYIACPIT